MLLISKQRYFPPVSLLPIAACIRRTNISSVGIWIPNPFVGSTQVLHSQWLFIKLISHIIYGRCLFIIFSFSLLHFNFISLSFKLPQELEKEMVRPLVRFTVQVGRLVSCVTANESSRRQLDHLLVSIPPVDTLLSLVFTALAGLCLPGLFLSSIRR